MGDPEIKDRAGDPKPLARYRERLLEVRRQFALYKDRVVVQAHWFLRGRYEHIVKLDSLTREIQELNIRYRVYRYAGWVMAAGVLLFVISRYASDGPLGVLGYAAIGTMILATIVMVLSYRNRRIRFVRFKTKTGRAGLDIGSAGNDPAAFREFIEQVRRRIP